MRLLRIYLFRKEGGRVGFFLVFVPPQPSLGSLSYLHRPRHHQMMMMKRRHHFSFARSALELGLVSISNSSYFLVCNSICFALFCIPMDATPRLLLSIYAFFSNFISLAYSFDFRYQLMQK